MANVVVELSGDEAKLFRSFQRLIEQQTKMDRKYTDLKNKSKQAGDAAQRAGQQGSRAFGRQAVSSLGRYAAGMVSISAAVGVFRGAMQDARAETEGAMQAVDRLVERRRALRQVAAGDDAAAKSADFSRLESRADALSARYGISRDQARGLMFSARSEGFEGAATDIARASGAGVIAAEQGALVAGQVPGLFPGSGLTPRQAVNATLVASQASRLNFSQLAEVLPQAAEGTSLSGTSPAETMALLSVLSSRFASGETTAARVKRLATKVGITPEFEGTTSIIEAVDKLQAMPEGERKGFLGRSQEINAAYQVILQERDKIVQRRTEIEQAISQAGTSQSAVAQAEVLAFDPTTKEGRLNAARVRLERQRSEQEIHRERQLATGGFATESAITRMSTAMEAQGVDPVTRFLSRTGMRTAQLFGAGEGTTAALGAAIAGAGSNQGIGPQTTMATVPNEVWDRIDSSSQQLQDAANKLDEASGKMTEVPQGEYSPAQRAAVANPSE